MPQLRGNEPILGPNSKFGVAIYGITLDSTPSSREGSPIWKLIKFYIPIIQLKLPWVLGNGKMIDIWNDNNMGNQPLLQF